jgi:hypothetical protein
VKLELRALPQRRLIPAPLAHRITAESSSLEIADAAIATWSDIGDSLHPILGQQGVAALYKRSLQLASAHHPWLMPMDAEALRSVIGQQASPEAALGAAALFAGFRELLVTLIGESLTEQLLRCAWEANT